MPALGEIQAWAAERPKRPAPTLARVDVSTPPRRRRAGFTAGGFFLFVYLAGLLFFQHFTDHRFVVDPYGEFGHGAFFGNRKAVVGFQVLVIGVVEDLLHFSDGVAVFHIHGDVLLADHAGPGRLLGVCCTPCGRRSVLENRQALVLYYEGAAAALVGSMLVAHHREP